MAALVGLNLYVWFVHKFMGIDLKDLGSLYVMTCFIDFGMLLGLAFLGFLSSFLIAFKPEIFIRSIEKSMAKQAARK